MITTTDNKVTIEFEHICPTEVVEDIKQALIASLQNTAYNEYCDLKQIQHANFFVLELLKQLI